MIRSATLASASLALLLASAGASAQAQADTPAPSTDSRSADRTISNDDDVRARTCLRSTGSRIVTARNERAEKAGKPQRCTAAAGKVYTRRDLESTGHMDIADALRSLDTSMR